MLKALVSKQLLEFFNGLFNRNKKTNKIVTIGLVALVVVSFLYIFSFLAFVLCTALVELKLDWLYFALMGIMTLAFSSLTNMFSAHSAIYKAKDNETLLAMPIEIKDIVLSKVISLLVMNLIYCLIAYLPAAVCYFIIGGFSFKALLGMMVSYLVITLLSLAISCVLGYLLAKLSKLFPNNNFIKVITMVLFFAIYFYGVSKAEYFINDAINSLLVYGESINTNSIVYLFGNLGLFDIESVLIFVLATILITTLVLKLLITSYPKVIFSENYTKRVKGKISWEKKSPFMALLSKEFSRFFSSATYMMNCSISSILLPILTVVAVIKLREILNGLTFTNFEINYLILISFVAIIFIASMNDSAVCSTSLEGENIWIIKSLPCDSLTILMSKLVMQLITIVPFVLFSCVAVLFIVPLNIWQFMLLLLLNISFIIFFSFYALTLGVRFANIHWVNEITVIKQSGAVLLYLFSNWVIIALAVVPAFIFVDKINIVLYMLMLVMAALILSFLLFYWIKKKGVKLFEEL